MNYPVWDVPVIGSGLVIGIIAVIHVLISHFAVGGGLFLALTETKALREGRRDWREKLKKHSKFFLVLTGVYGAMTGVGIWFSIGLVNPEGTSALIHNFVFGWAIEWVVFLVELSLAAVYYYTWDRVPDKTHERIGWLYAISSFLTLVIINGILSFKLTPSAAWLASAGTGTEPALFFQAFFNATYFPSLMLRTLACVSLAGIWSLVFFSRLDSDVEGSLKDELIRWSAKWLVPAYLLMPIFFAWYILEVPADHRALMGLGISTIGTGAFTQVTRMALITLMTSATIGGVVYFLAWRSPRDFSFGHAVSILFPGAHGHRLDGIRPRDASQALRGEGLPVLQQRARGRRGTPQHGRIPEGFAVESRSRRPPDHPDRQTHVPRTMLVVPHLGRIPLLAAPDERPRRQGDRQRAPDASRQQARLPVPASSCRRWWVLRARSKPCASTWIGPSTATRRRCLRSRAFAADPRLGPRDEHEEAGLRETGSGFLLSGLSTHKINHLIGQVLAFSELWTSVTRPVMNVRRVATSWAADGIDEIQLP
jgi:hypothetical protein